MLMSTADVTDVASVQVGIPAPHWTGLRAFSGLTTPVPLHSASPGNERIEKVLMALESRSGLLLRLECEGGSYLLSMSL